MRFVPREVEPYLEVVPGLDRRRAARTLLHAYTAGRRLLAGVGLWLAAAAAVVAVAIGALVITSTVADGEPVRLALLGGLVVLLGLAAGWWAVRRGVELLRAGALLSRSANSWMSPVPRPEPTVGHRVHELLSVLRPEIYPRVVLCSLAGLGAVVAASVVGYSVAGVGVVDDVTAALSVLTGFVAAAFTVLCAVPAVALWRGARRVQRCLAKDAAVLAPR